MKTLFTIHAGEYIVASHIEKEYKNLNLNVWLPSKDTGIDLLLTNEDNSKTVSIQVKFSKDFSGLTSKHFLGWWSLNKEKIANSKANFWIFVLHKLNLLPYQYIIIKPSELLDLFNCLDRNTEKIQTYFTIIDNSEHRISNRCWETRNLNNEDLKLIENNSYDDIKRDLTRHLNNWNAILEKLR